MALRGVSVGPSVRLASAMAARELPDSDAVRATLPFLYRQRHSGTRRDWERVPVGRGKEA